MVSKDLDETFILNMLCQWLWKFCMESLKLGLCKLQLNVWPGAIYLYIRLS